LTEGEWHVYLLLKAKTVIKNLPIFRTKKKLFLAVLFKELLKKSFVLHPEK
jgi:hypothetical protein